MPNLRLTLRGRFFPVLTWRCSFRTLGPWSFPYSTWPSTRLAPASLPRDPMSLPATSPASSSAVSPHMWVNIFFSIIHNSAPLFPRWNAPSYKILSNHLRSNRTPDTSPPNSSILVYGFGIFPITYVVSILENTPLGIPYFLHKAPPFFVLYSNTIFIYPNTIFRYSLPLLYLPRSSTPW